MRIVAAHEDEAIVGIPDVVGIAVVGVEPTIVVIMLDVEQVQVAVRIGFV